MLHWPPPPWTWWCGMISMANESQGAEFCRLEESDAGACTEESKGRGMLRQTEGGLQGRPRAFHNEATVP